MDKHARRALVQQAFVELEYQISRAMIEGAIGDDVKFRFSVPICPDLEGGATACEFWMRPIHHAYVDVERPKLVMNWPAPEEDK